MFISIMILIVAMSLPSINRNISSNLFLRISSLLLLYTGALIFNAFYIQSIGSGIGIYSGLFQITLFTQLFDIVIVLTGSVILIAWPLKNFKFIDNNLNEEYPNILSINNYRKKYSIIVLISTLGSLLLVSSSNLITLYLSLELQSFGVYILASLYRHSELAISAGLKYFLLGSLASCIILLGCGLIYTFTGLTNLESIYSLISVVDNNNNILLGFNLGLILIFIGLLFKIAAAPLHNWAPDVYADSATIITTWLTIMPKISILLILFEIETQISLIENINLILELNPLNKVINSITLNFNNSYLWNNNLILISSLFSLLIGTILGLAQSKIKRLLAYSTISHVGFILLALAINSEQSIEALMFYIIQYTITNLNTFLIIILFGYIIKNSFKDLIQSIMVEDETGTENDINYISELKGQFFLNPVLSITLTICLFSMAGIPPLIGFFSKQFILYSAIQNGYYFMSIIAIIVSIISASYYLKLIKILFTEEENISKYSDKELKLINNLNSNSEIEISSTNSFIISTLTLSILLFILKPSILLNSTTILSLFLFKF
uniref:NADH-ubiquinone oxidoreductase chain 2 n=1 Tax=Lactifluus piperatus TaxID=71966 RepID=A0A2Z4M947_9AGAM|nr:NADH dehydrogenase subunit 2 [Lactifluus piperatus]AWX53030.1 NADH dehydrogenase subunit 2 [Lactifluus piperatus]